MKSNKGMYSDATGIMPIYLKTILTILFLLTPLYFHANTGGRGLELPYNIPVWGVIAYLIGGGLYLIADRQRFIRPVHAWIFLVFPVIMILSGILTGSSQPVPWLFRQLYVTGGLLFLFALFQFDIRQRHIEQMLYVLAASSLINALIAIAQIFSPEMIYGWFVTSNNEPVGIFQQINVLASYLATGVVISFYLISRPSMVSASVVAKLLLIACIGTAAFIIAYTGSRIGLLSLVTGVLILFMSRWRQLKKRMALTLIAVLLLVGGALSGGTMQEYGGFAKVSKKTLAVTQGVDSSVRLNMYAIALELVAQKPVFGHGIGNFQTVWGMQNGDYHQRKPTALLPPYVTHPHNELVYWLIEGGMVSFLGIALVIGAIFLALARCGPQRGGAYAALLIPISLHTQVELPFYISSLHWFLWLFLLFIVLRHRTKVSTVPLSLSAIRLLKVTAVVCCIGSSYFMIHSARAQADINNFLMAKEGNGPYLQVALNNLYFRPYAEELAMRTFLHASLKNRDAEKVRDFAQWAEQQINVKPELKMFEDLINAYTFLRAEKERCKIIHTGAMMYPMNKPLAAISKSCKKED